MQTRYDPDHPLRFFHLHLQPDLLGGWILIRESGLQGARGRASREYFEQREMAERALIRYRDQRLKQGYRVVFREGELGETE